MTFLPLFGLLLLLPQTGGQLSHPHIAGSLPRNFTLCTGEISLNSIPQIVLTIPPDSESFATTGSLENIASFINSQTGTPTITTPAEATSIAAYIEDRTTITLFKRYNYRDAIRNGQRLAGIPQGSPVNVCATSQHCAADTPAPIIALGWFAIDLSLFNLDNGADWEFYAKQTPVRRMLISKDVLGRVDQKWLDSVTLLFAEYSEPNGVLLLEQYSSESTFVDETDPLLSSFDLHELTVHYKSPPPTPPPQPPHGLTSTYVINLPSRTDRRQTMLSILSPLNITPIIIPATSGHDLDLPNSPSLSRLFSLENYTYGTPTSNPYGDHSYRPNVLGCAVSHMELWARIVADGGGGRTGSVNYGPNMPLYLGLEDDVTFVPDFETKLPPILAALRNDTVWDVLFLGLLDEQNLYDDALVTPGVIRLSGRPRWSGGGAFAIVYKVGGARKLNEVAVRYGIQQPLDWFLFEMIAKGEIVAYKCEPGLAMSPEGMGRDSDNDEVYRQQRLVMLREKEKGGWGGVGGGVREVKFLEPGTGQCYKEGESVGVRLNMVVDGDSVVFVEAARGSIICFMIEGGGEEEGVVVVVTKGGRVEREFGDLGCIGWDEGDVRIEGLAKGEYVLVGKWGERQWRAEFEVG